MGGQERGAAGPRALVPRVSEVRDMRRWIRAPCIRLKQETEGCEQTSPVGIFLLL